MIELFLLQQQKNLSDKIFSHIADNGIIVCPIIKKDKQILIKHIKKMGKITYEEHDNVLFEIKF